MKQTLNFKIALNDYVLSKEALKVSKNISFFQRLLKLFQ